MSSGSVGVVEVPIAANGTLQKFLPRFSPLN